MVHLLAALSHAFPLLSLAAVVGHLAAPSRHALLSVGVSLKAVSGEVVVVVVVVVA